MVMRETRSPSTRKAKWLGPLNPLPPTCAVTTVSPPRRSTARTSRVTRLPMNSASLQARMRSAPRNPPPPPPPPPHGAHVEGPPLADELGVAPGPDAVRAADLPAPVVHHAVRGEPRQEVVDVAAVGGVEQPLHRRVHMLGHADL